MDAFAWSEQGFAVLSERVARGPRKVSVARSRFVHVSDSGGGVDQQVWSTLVGRTDRELAGLIVGNHAELLVREARVLLLAAAWADAYDVDMASPEYRPLVERVCAWGGEGAPEVSEYCAAELGALQGTGIVAARMLIADALDLRHRLPTLWARVQAGEVRAWQAAGGRGGRRPGGRCRAGAAGAVGAGCLGCRH